uniref:Uncharacterized protein n=1 Tax=Compsopogon caeruleus TaxID=31354 RepID=A0A7S1TDK8_9RHOD|mmetsp:Transcript_15424/g.31251  ORF Transcript_15424/g.31251 Transcript_15424/m.31251 type:complete len:280 (+) Transcript_15424:152-991(+)
MNRQFYSDHILPEGANLPSWAESVEPIRRLPKVPLRLHGIFSSVLFFLGLATVIISVAAVARQQGAISAGQFGAVKFPTLGAFGIRIGAIVFGVFLMIFSWISCVASENGVCGKIVRMCLVLIELILIVALLVVGSLAVHESSHPSQTVQTLMVDAWNAVVAQAEANGTEWLCSVQLSNNCEGFWDRECESCPPPSTCSNPSCLNCPNFTSVHGCGQKLLVLYRSWFNPVGILAILCALFLCFDFVTLVYLLPCFEVQDGDYVLLRRRERMEGIGYDTY